jgi:hypothetical protein
MGTYTRVYNFLNGSVAYGDHLTTELDALGSSCNNIVNAQISSGAAIADSKLAQITTGSKVALSGLVQGGTGQVILSGGGTAAWGTLSSDYLGVGMVVQTVNTQTGAVATGTTAIPVDDSIPQITEGNQYMTLAITPKSATNKLLIHVVAHVDSGADNNITAALFQDTTAGALAACFARPNSTDNLVLSFTHYMDAGTTSETTFRVRCGSASGTTTFNGINSSRYMGGVLASSITIQEIKV